jgi:tetratricopeptide (TPR) repeat protein
MKTCERRGWSIWVTLLIALSVSACQPQTVKPVDDKARYHEREKLRQIQRQEAQKRQIQAMLKRAEFQLGRDRLTTPGYDSAFGLFSEVLKLEPSNAQAKSGIQQVVIRYVQLARKALAHSNLSRAETYFAKAQRIAPANPLLAEFEASLQLAMKRQKTALNRSEIMLDPGALSKRDQAVLDVLQDVARRVMISDESLVIIARNDAEGRWLYQQMRKAAEGYRIRGDIQMGGVPKIVVHSPID